MDRFYKERNRKILNEIMSLAELSALWISNSTRNLQTDNKSNKDQYQVCQNLATSLYYVFNAASEQTVVRLYLQDTLMYN